MESVQPAQALDPALRDSLALVYSAQEKKPVPPEAVTLLKRVNERELYAALTHRELNGRRSPAAAAFSAELKTAVETFRANHGGATDLHKIADRLMRRFVRKGDITQEEYLELRNYAFGKSQLDSNRTALTESRVEGAKEGDTPLRAVSTAQRKIETNDPASAEEIAQFRAAEAEISRARWQEKKAAGLLGVKADHRVDAPNAAAARAVSGGAEVPEGFLWKPQSDSDGRLVILLPPALTPEATGIALYAKDGATLIERGRYSGIGNGFRQHYRFERSGGNYPAEILMVVTLRNGEKLQMPIKTPGSRIE